MYIYVCMCVVVG